MPDLAQLRESVELERQADLYAASCDLRNAVAFMREANRIRMAQFGRLNPNELRERTEEALNSAAIAQSPGGSPPCR